MSVFSLGFVELKTMATQKALQLPDILRCIFDWLLIVDEQSLHVVFKVNKTWFFNAVHFRWRSTNSGRIAGVPAERRWIYVPFIRTLELDDEIGKGLYYNDESFRQIVLTNLKAITTKWLQDAQEDPVDVRDQTGNMKAFLPSSLEKLELLGFSISVSELQHLMFTCPYLRFIHIEKARDGVTSQLFMDFLRGCPNLEVAIFGSEMSKLVTHETILYLASCHKLRHLDIPKVLTTDILERIQETRGGGFATLEFLRAQVEASAMTSLLRLFDHPHSHLRQISLQVQGPPGQHYSLQPLTMAPVQMDNIVLEFPQDIILSADTLKVLRRFSRARNVKIIATCGANIQCPDLTDADFAEIVKGMHELEVFELVGMECNLTVESLAALSHNCRSLKEVFLPPAFNFNFHSLANPSPFPENDVWFPWLASFGIGGFDPSPTPRHVPNISLFNRYCLFPLLFFFFFFASSYVP